MAYTDINSEDRLVQATFAEHLQHQLGWDSVYAWNQETFGPAGTLGRESEREVVLVRDLRDALVRLNPTLPAPALDDAVAKLTRHDHSRSLIQHNQAFYRLIRDGVPVTYHDAKGKLRQAQARVIDFRSAANNRFLAVRELKITGLRTPNYNRRADLVCFINGLPLVFIELKAVYKNIRAGFDGNPLRMNFEKTYHEIIAAYNADKDRASIEETFARMADLYQSLDAEQRRAVEMGLSEDQLALFDLLNKKSLNASERELLKQESRALLADLQQLIAPLDRWTEKEQTQAEVETFILDHLYMALPDPLYSAEEKSTVANLIYRHVWQQSASGQFSAQGNTPPQ